MRLSKVTFPFPSSFLKKSSNAPFNMNSANKYVENQINSIKMGKKERNVQM